MLAECQFSSDDMEEHFDTPENWESLAEFNILLEDDEEIYCHCTRIVLDDRDLLFNGEERPDKYAPEFLDGLKSLQKMGVELTFKRDLEEDDSSEKEEDLDVFSSPILDYDEAFQNDVEV